MYVTRRLSQLRSLPDSISARPDGPNSGYLVIQDEESETYLCFGTFKNPKIRDLPFPQNKELSLESSGSDNIIPDPMFFIPVLNQPLSSNLYYAINAHGKHIGEAFTCSSEEDKAKCLCCLIVQDLKPRILDPNNIYQQFEVVPYELYRNRERFFVNSFASDGFPPQLFRGKRFSIEIKHPNTNLKLEEALGIDSKLRAGLPEINSAANVVGKWYCPFMFVKEGTLRDQVKKSMYYEMTLEQRWEEVFSYRKNVRDYPQNRLLIDVVVEKEEVVIAGNKATWREENGIFWFSSSGQGAVRVGLREEIVKRMKWEEERGGWISGEEKQISIKKVEEFREYGEWNEFKFYVLMERFNLKRMDGSLVMSFDFTHSYTKTKWE